MRDEEQVGGESHELARCDAAGRPDTKPRGQARRNAKRWDGKRRLSETKTGSWGQSDQPDEDDDRCWCPPKVPEASPLIQLYPAHRHREPKNPDRKTHRVPARTAFLRSTVFSNRWAATNLQVCRSNNPRPTPHSHYAALAVFPCGQHDHGPRSSLPHTTRLCFHLIPPAPPGARTVLDRILRPRGAGLTCGVRIDHGPNANCVFAIPKPTARPAGPIHA